MTNLMSLSCELDAINSPLPEISIASTPRECWPTMPRLRPGTTCIARNIPSSPPTTAIRSVIGTIRLIGDLGPLSRKELEFESNLPGNMLLCKPNSSQANVYNRPLDVPTTNLDSLRNRPMQVIAVSNIITDLSLDTENSVLPSKLNSISRTAFVCTSIL
ncbi:hypothetical protein Bhyg_15968 [Pseudolycoriella hygida]|uniref:Uncharacterized protein n=1 Tax=Pseudolycoriella hygida TaxID=35572 RepID=A0A9Q0MKA5_9DIPT|nr:hypothetical protein Bhyg_15968 [Pseudolycoriella hygida]